jgi:hypothetical protein
MIFKFEEFIQESEVDLEFEEQDKIDNLVHNFLNDIEKKFGEKGKKAALKKIKFEK